MTTTATIGNKRLYEIMVLYDPSDASKDWDGLVTALQGHIDKFEGETVSLDQWADNRKLAYELNGLRRGSYLTGYFHVSPEHVHDFERSLQLDEKIVRHLLVKHEKLPPILQPKTEDKAENDAEGESTSSETKGS
jgi:small subunit ribosomal protein S6